MPKNETSANISSFPEKRNAKETRILNACWFSFRDGHATAGDLLALDVTLDWLIQVGLKNCDVALAPPFNKNEGVNLRTKFL